jgi:M6 family metalloprotease-like protein
VLLAVIVVRAQQRIPCDRDLRAGDARSMTRGSAYGSSVSSLQGDHHIPVILAAFQDVPFTVENVAQKWDRMLNMTGYSENGTAGCVGEYFRNQSNGQFNLTFDVLGPVTLPDSMKYYGKNDSQGDDIRPEEMVHKACLATGADFSPYDWDGDGNIDVVLVIFSGKGENRGGSSNSIWPHKYNIYSAKKVGDLSLYSYACVAELNRRGMMDGYGTLCHEFSHCLGLPDLYPSNSVTFSYFDEWDLMDGGNYANNGWALPNYSAFERSRCGWLDPVELDGSVSITDMPSMDEESCAYIIRNDDDPNQYYLLENRQQQGFDVFVPGNGLLVTYVDHYNGTLFPNSSTPHISLVYADNRDYRESEDYFDSLGGQYTEDGHNRYLSLAAYPYIVGDSINDHLSATSIPAIAFNDMSISNIRMSDDGRISFDFTRETTSLSSLRRSAEDQPVAWYDLSGRQLPVPPRQSGIYIIRQQNGKTKKIIL